MPPAPDMDNIFTPEAFVVRRSMPWAGAEGEGLVFVAFGRSFEPAPKAELLAGVEVSWGGPL